MQKYYLTNCSRIFQGGDIMEKGQLFFKALTNK